MSEYDEFDIPHFPIHPSYKKDKDKKEEEDDEEGKGKSKEGGAMTELAPPLFFGDWKVDFNTLYIENVKHKTGLNITKLNNYAKMVRFLIAIAQKKDWDVYGFTQALNQISQKTFNTNFDGVMNKALNDEGKTIDWQAGKLRTIKENIFKA